MRFVDSADGKEEAGFLAQPLFQRVQDCVEVEIATPDVVGQPLGADKMKRRMGPTDLEQLAAGHGHRDLAQRLTTSQASGSLDGHVQTGPGGIGPNHAAALHERWFFDYQNESISKKRDGKIHARV